MVGEVHRAALAPVAARRTAEHLGHHRLGVDALGDALPVVAEGREHGVVGLQSGDHARVDRLLADRQVDEALELVVRFEDVDAVLELADADHRPVEIVRQLTVKRAGDVLFTDRAHVFLPRLTLKRGCSGSGGGAVDARCTSETGSVITGGSIAGSASMSIRARADATPSPCLS